MSHAATNWAIRQRGIKPAAKVVLWHLCDRYHPDQGCFPSLDTLADDCEMSRRSVQDQIHALEAAGLVRVEKMPRDNGRLPRNRYRLAFEDDPSGLGQDLPKAKSALGKSEPPPLANSRKSLGQNLPPNSVRGTSKGTSNRARARKPEIPIPENWVPSDRNLSDARDRHFTDEEIRNEAAQFRDHHLARGTRFRDWDAAWRTWLGNARKFAPRVVAGRAVAGGRGQGSSLASIVARRRVEGGA